MQARVLYTAEVPTDSNLVKADRNGKSSDRDKNGRYEYDPAERMLDS